MSIDEIMALADEYVSASIEDHGYRSGAASAEYLEDTKRKLLAALESLIAAPAAPQQAEPVEIVPRVWRETLRKLTFMARTSGGTPGPDEGLQTACAEAETLLSKPYNYPPAAPQQAEPVAWMAFGGSIVHAVTRNAMDPIEAERFDVPLYLHPPAAEVQRLREALEYLIEKCGDSDDAQYSTLGTKFVRDIARRALEGGE